MSEVVVMLLFCFVIARKHGTLEYSSGTILIGNALSDEIQEV
jgi:hypothetical protein